MEPMGVTDEAVAVAVKPLHEIPWHSIADNQQILKQIGTSVEGLSAGEAARRLQECVTSLSATQLQNIQRLDSFRRHLSMHCMPYIHHQLQQGGGQRARCNLGALPRHSFQLLDFTPAAAGQTVLHNTLLPCRLQVWS